MKKRISWLGTVLALLLVLVPVQAQEMENLPEIKSDYYYMVDLENHQVMLDEGSEEKIYPASMTKMMTLLVAIEHAPALDTTMVLGPEVFEGLAEAHASVAGFKQGEEVTVKDLLYGLFLPSGADAGQALALEAAGSEEGFVELMNQKAQELGMSGTHFVNTSGLHDPDHYTTLRDLEKLMRYALDNPVFREIFQTRHYTAHPSLHPQGLVWQSTLFSKISTTDERKVNNDNIIGGKTGYTNPAGLCLASMAEKNGTEYLLITAHAPVSNTPYHILDADHIYDYFYENYQKYRVIASDQVLQKIEVPYVLWDRELDVTTGEDIDLNLPAGMDPSTLITEITIPEDLAAPVGEGEVIGQLTVSMNDEQKTVLKQMDLVSPKEYRRNPVLYGFHQFSLWVREHMIFSFLTVLAVVLLLILYRDYQREERRYRTLKRKKPRHPHL